MKNHLTESQVTDILGQSNWGVAGVSLKANKVDEAAKAEVTAPEAVVETAEHSCPLCKSTLSEEISDEVMQEHVGAIMDLINEVESVDLDIDSDDEDTQEV